MSFSRLTAKVLSAPEYLDFCQALFPIFEHSRRAGHDPVALLDIQAALTETVLHLQERKAIFRSDDDQVGIALAARLLSVVRNIADSIAWRVLGFDRVLLRLMGEHPNTGHLDRTILTDFQEARSIVERDGHLVLVNDLTTVLRHGDLTLIDSDGNLSIVETKSGRSSANNRRATRQKRRLHELNRFLNTSVRLVGDRTDFLLRLEVPLLTYHGALTDVITTTSSKGYHQVVCSDSVAIEGLRYLDRLDVSLPDQRPFDSASRLGEFSNLQFFEPTIPRVVPYGNFPLDNNSCFDLLCGEVILFVRLDFDALQAQYKQSGLEFLFPPKENMDAFLAASRGDRKKIADSIAFHVGTGDHFVTQGPELFADRIGFELIREEVVIEANRKVIELVRSIDLKSRKETRLLVGYTGDSRLWV